MSNLKKPLAAVFGFGSFPQQRPVIEAELEAVLALQLAEGRDHRMDIVDAAARPAPQRRRALIGAIDIESRPGRVE
ncbi:MAG: hypothetical protein ACREEM_18680, partial [Blastocatellia bacterium]